MKIALITDQHFGARGDSLLFYEFFDKFYSEVFFPYLENHKIDTVIMLGDTFDKRKHTNHLTVSKSKEFYFDKLRKYKVHMIVGNHDSFYKNTISVNTPSLMLGEYDNLRIHSEPTTISLPDGTTIDIMPWICSENYDRAMNLIKNTKSTVLMGHLELKGFEMYKGSVNDHGMDAEVFSGYDKVFSGHFHTKSTKGNITYLGAPYEMCWSDYNDARGFHIFDTTTKDLTYVRNRYTMHNVLYYDDSNTTIENLLTFDEKIKNTYVKVVVKNKTNPAWYETYKKSIEEFGVAKLQTVEDILTLEDVGEELALGNVEDTQTIIKNTIESLETKVDKTKLTKFMNDLYLEAQLI